MKKKEIVGLKAYVLIILIWISSLLVFALISALALSKIKDPSSMIGASSLVTLLLSAAISGSLTPKIRKNGWIIIGSGSALTIALALTLIQKFVSGGSILGSLLNSACFIATFFLFAALSSRQKKRRVRR